MWAGILNGVLDEVAPRRCVGCDVRMEGGLSGFCGGCGVLVERAKAGPGAYVYGGPLADGIRRLKYEGRTDLVSFLGEMLVEAAGTHAGRVDRVVPVPLHRRRMRERGFNQAALLARPVALALGVRFEPGRLRRSRPTAAQAGLGAVARRDNVRGAFAVRGDLAGARVLLVDDVCTTGATLAAAREALLEAGAEVVRSLALAGGESA